MNHKIKDLVGIAAFAALFALVYGSLSFVDAYTRSVPSSRAFAVSGEGKIVAVPDVAKFSFSVITQGGTDLGALQADNTTKTNGAISFVKSQGVDAKDIATQGYDISPRYQYSSCKPTGDVCPPPEIVGYTVTQSVAVKVRSFNKLGGILTGVVANGANSVSQLAFTVDDLTKFQEQARTKAIAQAQSKASAVAQAAGFRLGPLLSVEETGSSQPPYYAYERAMGLGGGGVPAPQVEPGSQEISVTMSLRYGILQ